MNADNGTHSSGLYVEGLGLGEVHGTARGYLNTAAESLPLAGIDGAVARYVEFKSLGSRGREPLDKLADRTRRLVGATIGASPANITFVASTSRGLDIACKSIDWRSGDNIVFGDTEFPTIAFASSELSKLGVEARTVASIGGVLSPDSYVERIDDRTRLVVVSLASYRTGQLMDTSAICRAAHAHGAAVFADAVQAMGAVEIAAGEVDYLCAGTFKWLGAAHGLAIFYARERPTGAATVPYVAYRGVRDLFPAGDFGHFEMRSDARRFDEGMPNYLGVSVLESSLSRLASIGISRVQLHNRALTDRLLRGLTNLGIVPDGPRQLDRRTSIVSFRTSAEAVIGEQLAQRGSVVWARDGSVRISMHLYNTFDDVDDVLAKLDEIDINGRPVRVTQPDGVRTS